MKKKAVVPPPAAAPVAPAPARAKKEKKPETAESMASRQRDISVSEFFLKNRHLLGFDSPRRALLTAVKEAVDNSMDACEEAGVVPEISVELEQIAETRFRVTITDNGPGIVKAQIPKIFAKLLYGSKFHRLRMSRGQQGIGISAAGMYGQLTTGSATRILSRTKGSKMAHAIASVARQLHDRGILHGDLYAHNIFWRDAGDCLLGDFGAASFYNAKHESADLLQRLEVRAFGCLLEELLTRCEDTDHALISSLWECQRACCQPEVAARPSFAEIAALLQQH